MNTGPENMRGLDFSAPLKLIEPAPFEKKSSQGDDCTEDFGDWIVMMVTMEDCEDQTMTDEPTPEQTNVQPSTYAAAVSMTNSHNQPVRIENFLQDLNLGTPELLKGTFKLHTPTQGGDCFFAS